jgi:hypothetical protein
MPLSRLVRPDQDFRRDAETFMQSPDHFDREGTFPVETSEAGATADESPRSRRLALAVHAELDRINGIGRIDRMMLILIRLDRIDRIPACRP